jgi:lipid-A-disaccharide synthase
MKLFIVSGDYSGDLHGAAVATAWQAQGGQVAGVGGPNMAEAGVSLIADQHRMGRIGPLDALMGIPYHYQLGRRILAHLAQHPADGVLLIDYGGFNLRLAQALKKAGHRVFYFIPPQLWASRAGRMRFLQQAVEHVFCIFPFEVDLYQRHGVPVTFVGHPLAGALPPPVSKAEFCQKYGLDATRPLVGFFPGSRRLEMEHLLRPMLASARALQANGAQVVFSKAPSLPDARYHALWAEAGGLAAPIVELDSRGLLSAADAVVVASGTITLEAALYGTPTVLLYKGPALLYPIFRRICQLPCIGLPNILTDMAHPIVPELLQHAVTHESILWALKPLLDSQSVPYERAMAGFGQIQAELAPVGGQTAATNVAQKLMTLIGHPQPLAK